MSSSRLLLVFFSVFVLATIFLTNPQPAKALEPAILLGKIFARDAKYASCPDERFYFGDNCGDTLCYGAPNYTVTWEQGVRSNTVSNNECFSSSPRYTFEHTDIPDGDPDGEPVTITVQIGGTAVFIGWSLSTSNSIGDPYPGSSQSGIFSPPGPLQTFTVTVYRDGDYRWNHLWFEALPYPPPPSPSPTPPPPSPVICPIMTCSYSEYAPGCDSELQIVTGIGCSGFNCVGCDYIYGCSTITCYVPPPPPTPGECTNDPALIADIPCIIRNIIKLLAPASAFAIFIMLLFGGFKFLTSGGDPKAVAQAKTILTMALIGIILVVTSWLILILIRAITSVDIINVGIS